MERGQKNTLMFHKEATNTFDDLCTKILKLLDYLHLLGTVYEQFLLIKFNDSYLFDKYMNTLFMIKVMMKRGQPTLTCSNTHLIFNPSY